MRRCCTAPSAAERRSGLASRPLLLVLAVLIGLAALLPAGCASGTGTASSPSPTTTSILVSPGGKLRIGVEAATGQFDPALMAASAGDVLVNAQVLENLVAFARDFSLEPALAKEWGTADAKTWTFTLRKGVKFSNGKSFTSADVIYSMDRLRDTQLGSPAALSLANIESLVATDSSHVTFVLKAPDAEFPNLLTDYRCKMLCKSVKSPMKKPVGTGPFILKSVAENGAILTRNPKYWGRDADGNELPYLDELEFVYSSGQAGTEGLLNGSIDWVGGLTARQKQTVEAERGLETVSTTTNRCYELQIRCDLGLGERLALRQALMCGTDRQALVELVTPDAGAQGNGTLIGPFYSACYLGESPACDPESARRLIADAGFAGGITIELVAQSTDPIPALAKAWKAQMKSIGVTVRIRDVDPVAYYTDEGKATWFQADFGIVDWGTLSQPVTYLQQSLTTTGSWNYSRWSNPEFDALVEQIPRTLDPIQRSDLYRKAQSIVQAEAPMINFLVVDGVAGEVEKVDGVELAADWTQTEFRAAYFAP